MGVKDLEFYEEETLADGSIREFMEEEIAQAPRAPGELKNALPRTMIRRRRDSGGDIDAEWEDVNDSGAESVFGHNPTPDQSDVEENAHAMGIDYQDNEPIDVLGKIEKRDRDRFELDENSKADEDMI